MNDTPFIKKGRFTALSVALMFLLPIATAFICLCVGRMSVPLGDVIRAIRSLFTGETAGVQNGSIIVNLRLPRILMAIIVGAGLTCAGNAYQALFSNPLATPDILGVTSGTCVGAILAIILSCSIFETQMIALVFGLLSVWFTLKIAGKNSSRSMVYLVLAGVIASSLFNAVGSLLKYTADPQDKLPEITYWLMGSFTGASYKKIAVGSPLILSGIVVIYLLRWRLNILSLSEDEAKASGINLPRTRLIFILGLHRHHRVGGFDVRSGRLDRPAHSALCPHDCGQQQPIRHSRQPEPWRELHDTDRHAFPNHQHHRAAASILTAIIGAPVFITLLNKNRSNFR